MSRIKTFVARLVQDEQGQDLIEYALLGALIAVAVTVTLGLVGVEIDKIFTKIITSLQGA
jgi:Flp pilus assembly pilin Flp